MNGLKTVYPADSVTLREVGLRDGLQLVKKYPSTNAKLDWLRREAAAGVKHFEVGSFLPVKTMPQFADIRELVDFCTTLGVRSSALALNDRGAQDAVQAAVNEIVTVVSASEEHSQANARRSRQDAIDLIKRTVELAKQSESQPTVQTGIAMSFGCSIAGEVKPDEVLHLASACMEAGAGMVSLADTVGFAGPRQVSDLVTRLRKLLGDEAIIGIHLHDTRGMGIANASAALDAGARVVDGALGGLGGCPFAPGATGNVVIEDLVYLCERQGFATGIDLDKLIAVREILATEMPDEQLFGSLARAGAPRQISWDT